MPEIKLCKDCKYFSRKVFKDAECTHKELQENEGDYIYGYKKVNKSCDKARGYANCCGEEAEHFEEKESVKKEEIFQPPLWFIFFYSTVIITFFIVMVIMWGKS